jgi:hypothetical protein
MTQAMGALMGSALLSTYQMHREQVYSAAIVADVDPTDPIVADRLRLQQQSLARVIADPALRAAQGTAQLAQAARREANVRAYNDVFALTAGVAVLYLLWMLALAGRARQRAFVERMRAAAADASAMRGTDAAAPQDAPGQPPTQPVARA